MGLFSHSRNKKSPRNPLKKSGAVGERHSRRRPFLALSLALVAVLWLVAFLAYAPVQETWLPSWQPVQTTLEQDAGKNPVGKFGATLALLCYQCLGWAALLLPVFLAWAAYLCFARKAACVSRTKLVLMAASLCAGAGLLAQLQAMAGRADSELLPHGFGGLFGGFFYRSLDPVLGNLGALSVFVSVYVIGLVLVFIPNPTDTFERWLAALWRALAAWWAARCERRAQARDAKRIAKAEREAAREAEREAARAEAERKAEEARRAAEEAERVRKAQEEERARVAQQQMEAARIAREAAKKAREEAKRLEKDANLSRFDDDDDDGTRISAAPEANAAGKDAPESAPMAPAKAQAQPAGKLKIIAEEKVEPAAVKQPVRRGKYTFPKFDLLTPPVSEADFPQEDHEARMRAIVDKLAQFNIAVTPAAVQTGPVITRYEVQPAPGVRVNKIANADKDLALGLKATSVRILAPVPGKDTVGIEAPNRNPRPVGLREILESKAWAEAKAEIPIVLGKDVTGRPMVFDLAKMPHALIAGGTGSGKSVCVNSIIASIAYHSTPQDVRLIMVDPKVVELQVYNDLPHMLIPVVTDMRRAAGALKYLVKEMERRYHLFAKAGVRNLIGFNAKIEKNIEKQKEAQAMEASLTSEERAAMHAAANSADGDVELPSEKLPYIVLIIDELADLMMSAKQEVEPGIQRLTAKARAAGIHLIVATQRPSVDIVTGVIKANLPCRIAFKVASNTDSRTILDSPGAEVLLGRGDMLFIPPGTSDLVRAQGSFIGDEEINALVAYLKEKNGGPSFADDVRDAIEAASAEDENKLGGGDDEGGDLESRALRVLQEQVATGKQPSVSYLQRRLGIGYNKAANVFESFVDRGIIRTGPDGKKEIVLDDL